MENKVERGKSIILANNVSFLIYRVVKCILEGDFNEDILAALSELSDGEFCYVYEVCAAAVARAHEPAFAALSSENASLALVADLTSAPSDVVARNNSASGVLSKYNQLKKLAAQRQTSMKQLTHSLVIHRKVDNLARDVEGVLQGLKSVIQDIKELQRTITYK